MQSAPFPFTSKGPLGAGLAEHLDENGRRLVVRNGHAEPRTITTAAGRIEVQVRGPR